MKKILITLIMGILAFSLFAQTTLQITEPPATYAIEAPIYVYFDYTITQFIYTSTELATANFTNGLITHLSFQAANSINLTSHDSWNIKIMETAATDLEDWIDTSSATVAFSGTVSPNSLSSNAWLNNIALTTPFSYSGTQNLLIQITNNTGSWRDASNAIWRAHSTGADNNLTRFALRDDDPYDLEDPADWELSDYDELYDYRTNIRITYLPPLSTGADLVLATFTGPAILTGGTANMVIGILNMGTVPATAYTVDILLEGNSTPLFTIPVEDVMPLVPLPNGYQTTSYTITPAMYGLWTIAGVGDINLIARVNFTGQTDVTPLDNTKTLATYIMPPPITTFPYTETFEAGSSQWTIVNGTQTNKWHWGTAAAAPGGGTHSMYISNDNGVTNAYTFNSQSVVQFFTDFTFPATATAITLSFDFRGDGTESSSYDYLRVHLIPSTTTPTAGTQLNTSTQIGQYDRTANWTNIQLAISASNAGQTRRLVFEWRNDNSGGTNPPSAVDNIKITTYTQTDPPLAARIGTSAPANNSNYISTAPALTWQAPATGNTPVGYKVYLEDHTPVPGTDTAKATVLANATFTYTPSPALSNSTQYYWMVVPYITTGADETLQEVPAVDCPVWSFTTVMPPHTVLPFTDDFENGSAKWNIENGTQTNKWKLGTATATEPAEHSMYISYNDNQNLYDNTVASNVHFFTDITFPAGITGVVVKFDYKGNGQSSGGNDDLRVFLAPTSVIPAAGTAPSTTNQIGSTYAMSPAWTPAEIVLAGSTYVDSTRRLIFSWRNDAANGAQPPLAVDNVSVSVTIAGQPPQVARISSPAHNATGVSLTPTLTWQAPAGGNIPSSTIAGGYKLYYGTSPDPTTNTPITRAYNELSYAITTPALDPTTKYYWMVVPYITVMVDDGDGGEVPDDRPAVNCPVWSFTTLTPEPPTPGLLSIGTGSTGVNAPINPYRNFSVSQQIYLKTELGDLATGGLITHVSFQANSSITMSPNNNQWVIYMGETVEEEFATTTIESWIPLNAMQLVFDGTITSPTSLTAGAWYTIALPETSQFMYTGTSNLVIFVNEYASSYAGSANSFRGSSTSTANRTIYNSMDGTTQFEPKGDATWVSTAGSGGASTRLTDRPNLRLNYKQPTAGLDLAVTAFTGPANLTGNTDFTITITNLGTTTVDDDEYEIVISEVDGTFAYTIPADDDGYIGFTAPFQTTEFVIESEVYESWMVTRGTTIDGVGHVTLKAEVVIIGDDDDDDENNFLTHDLYIVPAYDLAITEFVVPGTITLPTTVASIAFKLTNNGSEDLADDDYDITLYVDGVDSGITIAGKAIEAGDFEPFEVTATQLSAAGITARNEAITLKLEVAFAGLLDDELPDDNEVEVDVYVTDALSTVTVTGSTTQYTVPFHTNQHDNVAQSIYTAADLGGVEYGMISHIMYKFTRTTGTLTPYPVNIYMKNTDKASFATVTDWVPEAQFTPVVANYNLGLTDYPAGTHEIWIPLDEPFLYTGGNLVIMTHKDHETFIASSNVFFTTPEVAGSNVTLEKNAQAPGNNYELSLTAGSGNLRNYKPQTGFAFDMTGATDLGDIAITGFVGPTLIPAGEDEEIVITLRNMSSTEGILAEDYSIVISEMIPNEDPQVTPTWQELDTFTSLTEIATENIDADGFNTFDLTIPSEVFNLWSYVSLGGAVTLKAEIVFENTFTDDEATNDEALLLTSLAPAIRALEMVDLSVPAVIPSVEAISVKVENTGRATVANKSYTLEIFESYITIDEQTEAEEWARHLLYTIGDSDDDAEELAVAIALGANTLYEIENDVYNEWIFDSAPNEPFNLLFRLTYNDTASTVVKEDSLATVARPGYDLALTAFNVPATMPHADTLYVTVQNNGRDPVEADSYTIEIFEKVVDNSGEQPVESWESVYLIEDTFELAIGTFKKYDITWEDLFLNSIEDPFATESGAITLKAVVTDVTEPTALEPSTALANNTLERSSVIAPALDIEALQFTGPAILPSFTPVTIPVRNNGRYEVADDDYLVKVYHVVGSTEGLIFTFGDDEDDDAVVLAPGATEDLVIPAAIVNELLAAKPEGAFTFKVVVEYIGDLVGGNNTKTLAAQNLHIVADGVVEAGVSGTSTQYYLPFNFYNRDGISQSIYGATHFGISGGLITHINYTMNVTTAVSNYNPVKLYMKNTTKTTFATTTDWETGNICVVESLVLPLTTTGTKSFWVELDTPFIYTGGNVVITTFGDQDNYYTSNNFLRSPETANSNISMYRGTDSQQTDYNPVTPIGTGTRVNYIPQTRFAITLTSADPDIAIVAFTGPDMIPGTEPMQITVMNLNADPVLANAYSIDIFEGALTTRLGGVIASEALGMASVGATRTYEIPASVYNYWTLTSPAGAVNLRAVLTYALDENEANNTKIFATHLRPAYDLELVSVTGPGLYPAVAPLKITVQNNGRAAVVGATYTIDVTVGSTSIATITAADAVALGLGEAHVFSIPAATINPLLSAISGSFTFDVALTSTVTEEDTNNNDGEFTTTFFNQFTTSGIVEVGIGDTTAPRVGSANALPFSLYYEGTISQSIYTQADLAGVTIGEITHIYYKFRRGGGNINLPVNIYLANAQKSSFTSTTDWKPSSEFILVKAGFDLAALSLENGDHDLWIEISPFLYTGGDLIVLTHRPTRNSSFNSNDGFFQTTEVPGSNVSLYRAADTDITVTAPGTGTLAGYKPQMRFAFNLGGDYGILSGNITQLVEGTPAAISGVRVTQANNYVLSSATGAYSIYLNKATNADDIVFSKEGFRPETLDISTLTWGGTPVNDFPTDTENVVMTAVPPATVTGNVTFADSGLAPTVSLTVRFGTQTATTNASTGAFSRAGLYPYTTYPVTITLPSSIRGYLNYSDVLYFEPEDLEEDGGYIYNIAIEENVLVPLYASASTLPNGDREVHWFHPSSDVRGWFIGMSSQTSLRGQGTGDFIAAQRWSAAMLANTNLAGVGSYVTSVEFVPATAASDFTAYVWVGANLDNPDVNNPILQQQISYTAVAEAQNEIIFNKPILVEAGMEIAVGIRSNNIPLAAAYGGSGANTETGSGNKYYINGAWTTLDAVTSTVRDNWYIASIFVVAPQASGAPAPVTTLDNAISTSSVFFEDVENGFKVTPTIRNGGSSSTRSFNSTYNVYRLLDGVAFDPDSTPLNANPVGNAFYSSYVDNVANVPAGDYRFAVTAVHTGSIYDGGYIESDPEYTNYLHITPRYVVSGSIYRSTEGTVAGYKFHLANEGANGVTPPDAITNEEGEFSFTVYPGTYTLSLVPGLNADGWEYNAMPTMEIEVVAADYPIEPINVTTLAEGDMTVPQVTALKGNYPNPFNPSTTIAFDIAQDGMVAIEVYNIKGQKVKTVTNEAMKAGRYTVVWNGDDNNGREVGSGVYFYRMTSGGYTKTQKMLLMK